MTLPQIDLWLHAPRDEDAEGRAHQRRGRAAGIAPAPAFETPLADDDPRDDTRLVDDLRSDVLSTAHAALEVIYRTHAPAIARFVYGYVRSRSVAEDVVSDLFIAIWDRRETWSPAHGIRAYLYTAARHRALNVLRGAAREMRRARAVVDDSSQSVEPVSANEDSVQGRLDALMAALPEESRRLAALRWRDGLSPTEIAAVLGIDRSAVDNRLSRLVKRLRALVATAQDLP